MNLDPNTSSQQNAGPAGPPAAWCGAQDWPRGHRLGRAIIGLTLAAWGVLLLLKELGYAPAGVRAFDFWPVLLVGVGVSIVLRRRSLLGLLGGTVVAAVGVVHLAHRLGYAVPRLGFLWPLVVIAAGLALVFRRPRWHHGHRARRAARDLGHERTSADLLQRSVTMGGLKLSVDSQTFRGAALSVTMGGVEVDLRRAAMLGDEVAVDVALFMGGLELWVPPSWTVSSEISPLLGAVEDHTRPVPDAGSGVQKRLLLRGTITMGAVTVRN